MRFEVIWQAHFTYELIRDRIRKEFVGHKRLTTLLILCRSRTDVFCIAGVSAWS
jgi:hypothetical protein